jgi:hypothetical protein
MSTIRPRFDDLANAFAASALLALVACSSTTTTSPCADAGLTGPLPPGCTLTSAGCGPVCGAGASGPSPTQADCEMFGAAAGCATSTLVPGDAGDCVSGCAFTSCSKANPDCTLAPRDGG